MSVKLGYFRVLLTFLNAYLWVLLRHRAFYYNELKSWQKVKKFEKFPKIVKTFDTFDGSYLQVLRILTGTFSKNPGIFGY